MRPRRLVVVRAEGKAAATTAVVRAMAVAAARVKARWVVASENGRGEVVEAGEVAGAALVEVEAPLLTVAAMEAARV